MISLKSLKAIEYDKIMQNVSSCAVLEKTKERLRSFVPLTTLCEVEILQKQTEEAYKLLYTYSTGGVYFADDISEQLKRVDIGATLTNGELLKVSQNLKSARIIRTAINSVNDQAITILPEIANRLYVNLDFENEINEKIISEDEISDNASPKLYSIRKSIRNINAKIRNELNSFMRGGLNKFLQDSVVTMRQDRYVIPVKSEYRSFVKGFIHDQSSSGATVFIEPEHVMELNNDLKRAIFDETEEIHRILAELSSKVSYMSDALRYNYENLIDLDVCFARAEYSFKNKCTKPLLNDKGIVFINRGRHPLIDKEKVIPVTVKLGDNYNFLLITGPNTGGKTVTLKLTGLLSAMAMSGLFVPAEDDSKISVFSNIYCDIGDEQSIEQNLSTFSSHITNIINIINNVNNNSLVLLDEIGAGTDPEEGSALALAIIKKLIKCDCFGIITTHYSALKEYAVDSKKIENASMEFDAKTLKPLYKLNIGIPGSSNAIDIAKTLGLDKDIIEDATKNLSQDKVNFESVLKKAEESRLKSDKLSLELEKLKAQKEKELNNVIEEKEKIKIEREKIYINAKHETKRIVADKLAEAEEIIDELKNILKRVGLESKEVFRASELKNRLKNSRYLTVESDDRPFELVKIKESDLTVGNRVFVNSLGAYAKLLSVRKNKKEVEILIGDIKTVVKITDLYNAEQEKLKDKDVKIFRPSAISSAPKTELNVVGKTSLEAITELENFIDQAIMNNLEEIKIIHGVGAGVLLKEIRSYLKKDKNVLEFRRGNYGEGENGVTIVKLK
ncbi:MAG: endonuclease MutS2 [Clostridiales bacterium]|nr:endonuclease MutS2 [Clostridiales bacterium]